MPILRWNQSGAEVGTTSKESAEVNDPKKKWYHELVTVKAPTGFTEKGNKPNWQLNVDKATGMKFSAFHNNKDNILNNTSARLKAMERLASQKIQVWCQDNAGENKVFGEEY